LPPGPQGIQGPIGPQGPAGSPPAGYCVLGDLNPTTGKYNIICGGTEIGDDSIEGVLDACKVDKDASTGFQLVLVCNGTTEIYACSGAVFDPAGYHCATANVVDYISNETRQFGVIEESLCNGDPYDMRLEFCDKSGSTDTKRPLCGGKNGKPYRNASTYALGQETCSDGKVLKRCGAGTTAPFYEVATQFCMSTTTNPPTVADRCGNANIITGIYSTGKNDISGDIVYYNSPSVGGIPTINGEYNTANGERCENGKVVKLCGTELYEEKTHFCAVGDVVAPHCTDRQIYDPTTQYCSFMGNSYNGGIGKITERPADGFFHYDADALECNALTGGLSYDPSSTKCLKYASTAIEFCGRLPVGTTGVVGLPTAQNKPNDGAWKWEYCRNLTGSPTGANDATLTSESGSIIRCGELMVPPTGLTAAAGTTCICIKNAVPISTTTNGCRCANGFKYNFEGTNGMFRNDNNYIGHGDGGVCEAQLSGSSCSAGSLRFPNTSTTNPAFVCGTVGSGTTYACNTLTSTPLYIDYISSSSTKLYNCAAGVIDASSTQDEVNIFCGTTANSSIIIAADGAAFGDAQAGTSVGVSCVLTSAMGAAAKYESVGGLVYNCAAESVANADDAASFNLANGKCE